MNQVLDKLELRGQLRGLREWNEGYEELKAIPHSFAIEFKDNRAPWAMFADSEEEKVGLDVRRLCSWLTDFAGQDSWSFALWSGSVNCVGLVVLLLCDSVTLGLVANVGDGRTDFAQACVLPPTQCPVQSLLKELHGVRRDSPAPRPARSPGAAPATSAVYDKQHPRCS